MVRFGKLDLLKDPYPRTRDLILCRNVVIYFNDDAKERIYERFHEILGPGGTLFVGSTERVNDAARLGWERPGTFFYRKPGGASR
jgi:chemotaxis protein methyltransferase CheR